MCGTPVLQVVLSHRGETSTAVNVYRSDFFLSGGNPSSGGAPAGGEAEEGLLLRDWVVGSQVGPTAFPLCSLSHSTSATASLLCGIMALVASHWSLLPSLSVQALTAAASTSSSFHQSTSGFGDQLLMLNSQGGWVGWPLLLAGFICRCLSFGGYSHEQLLLLLCPAGVRVVQLLSWQQRLSALASQQHQLRSALLAAVRIYQVAAAGGQQQQQGVGRQQQAAWPADGHAAAVPEVQRQLLTILCAYAEQGLSASEQEQPQSAAQLADTAIACCLLVRRPDALWSDLFPRFARQRAAAAAFLQQVLPFILSDQLPSVAPEVRVIYFIPLMLLLVWHTSAAPCD